MSKARHVSVVPVAQEGNDRLRPPPGPAGKPTAAGKAHARRVRRITLAGDGRLTHPPAFRHLRVFALDPSMSTELETVGINELVLDVPWEVKGESEWSALERGPIGEYVEVIDYDPASQAFYAPVDLNDPHLLAQDGLTPAEDNPQFHQQMVYAVAMTTIGHFERALGRVVLWSPRIVRDGRRAPRVEFVRRLRIYPHALREANAYYSWRKKALLFGYFTVSAADAKNAPGTRVFTCLSHDIIAHETAHALLDGIHPRFMEPTNRDVLALHEAFADIVAIFQRFSHPTVLRHQIAKTRGALDEDNLMSKLGLQFGEALGQEGALRDALGHKHDAEGKWTREKPDPRALERTVAPHARGAILVAAAFDAFLLIYASRVADLVRIATQGTGLLSGGALHPDLVQRLANEAAKSARHILQMCIRALDYCPPIDVTFGDYLRAIITADHDLYPTDRFSYRVAVLEAFRRHGIYPAGATNLSPDAVRWPMARDILSDSGRTFLAGAKTRWPMASPRMLAPFNVDWDLQSDREDVWRKMNENAAAVRRWLKSEGRKYWKAFGLTLDPDAPRSVFRGRSKRPAVEVFVRTAQRRGYKESLTTDLVVEITQWRQGFYDRGVQAQVDAGALPPGRRRMDFKFRRGCTILISPNDRSVRYVIRTAGTVADDRELDKVRTFLTRENPLPGNAFDAGPCDFWPDEDILQLHRMGEKEGDDDA